MYVLGSISILHADDDHLVLYECERVTSDGHCDVNGLVVVVYGRERQAPMPDVYERLFVTIESVCLQRGDFEESIVTYSQSLINSA